MKIVQLPSGTSIAVEPIYANYVKDDKTIIIFLHEALGSFAQWKYFPQDVCNLLELNGIVYEREGHGSSSGLKETRNKHYLHNYAWTELPQLLDIILSPDKKVVLVGHSDGGTIALLYAAKFPHKVKAIVSMAAHVIVEKETLAGIQPAIDAYAAGKLDGLQKFHGNKTNDLFYAWANTWKSPNFEKWNICEDISELNAPTLIIQGKQDQYGTAKQVGLIADSISGESHAVLIEKCGHLPHLEQGQRVLTEINDWYSQLEH